jgi:hypothetical protein
MADEMDRMFDEFRLGQRWTTPPLRETRAEGWAAEIAVFQKNSELSIRANLYRSERSYGSFGRVIPLADGAITEQGKANKHESPAVHMQCIRQRFVCKSTRSDG